MTKAFKYLSYMLLGAACAGAAWSCTDETYELPEPNITPAELVEGVAFTVEHDAQNPNIIHLKSLMPASYQVAWVTPHGRKTGGEATLSIPFDGSYEVQMGVDTRGGYVWSEPYTFTIDEFCADFVDHYLWKRISGGVGQSKTWQLDLGVLADGSWKATFFGGPHWFFTNTYNWDCLHAANESETVSNNFLDNEDWEASMAITPNSDWSWFADYASNDWLVSGGAQNFGYITFDLINGANVTITDANGNVVSKGTYMLDTDAHTVTLSDTYPLEATDNRTHERFLQLLYLSNDAMLLMAPTEGVTLNYVTKEYFETYTPPVATTITLPEGWDQTLGNQFRYCTWALDQEAPFDWYDLGGAAINGFKSSGDYPDTFKPVSSTVEEFALNLCSPEVGQYTATLPDGSNMTGEISVNPKGFINFSNGIGYLPLGGSTVKLEGSSLTMIAVTFDDFGRVESFVAGLPQADVNGTVYQYLGYKFVADFGGEKKETYKAVLSWNDTGTWTQIDSAPIFVEDGGTYTIKLDAPYTSGMGDPCLWLDVNKILNTHMDCDVVLKDIKIDGVSVAFDDSAISRSRSSDKIEEDGYLGARRYICNPWGLASCFTGLDQFHATSGYEVTFTVSFSTGNSFLGE